MPLIWLFPYSWRSSPFWLLETSARCCMKRYIWASTLVPSSKELCFWQMLPNSPEPQFTHQWNGDGNTWLVGLPGQLSVMSHAFSWHTVGAQNCCCPTPPNRFSCHLLLAPLNHLWPCFHSTPTCAIVTSLWHLHFLHVIRIVCALAPSPCLDLHSCGQSLKPFFSVAPALMLRSWRSDWQLCSKYLINICWI